MDTEVSWTYNWKNDSSYVPPAAMIFGRKRSHFYGRYLVAFDSQIKRLVYVYRPDGKAIKFSSGVAGWENVNGDEVLSDVIVEGVKSGWTLVDPQGLTEHYDLKGKLTALVDRNGRQQVLTYRASGEPATVTDDQGRQLKFEYTSGRATKIVLPEGGNILLSYSSAPDLTEVKHAGGTTIRYLGGSLTIAGFCRGLERGE